MKFQILGYTKRVSENMGKTSKNWQKMIILTRYTEYYSKCIPIVANPQGPIPSHVIHQKKSTTSLYHHVKGYQDSST